MTSVDETTSTDPAMVRRGRHRVRTAVLVVGLIAVGWAARSVAVDGSDSAVVRWLPWMSRTSITLYFGESSGEGLVPVSRTVSRGEMSGEVLVAELLGGPAAGTGLRPLAPEGTTVRSVTMTDGVLTVDLSGDPAALEDALVLTSLWHSLTSWSAVERVELSIDGVPVDLDTVPGHLVFFWDAGRDLLVGFPTPAANPREAIDEFLTGPVDGGPGTPSRLIGLPDDVRLVAYDFNPSSGLLTLDFSYVPSVRAFALDQPEGMRRVLEGLITTMTSGFPEVGGVYLDFEGQATLGLGQCADLLRTLQLRPEILNDERLLARSTP